MYQSVLLFCIWEHLQNLQMLRCRKETRDLSCMCAFAITASCRNTFVDFSLPRGDPKGCAGNLPEYLLARVDKSMIVVRIPVSRKMRDNSAYPASRVRAASSTLADITSHSISPLQLKQYLPAS
ncbi:MAG: hypothetical protein GXY48_02080 [Methanomicrobiales archaeon]|nr:hypothetical protein [Methanomicrobiales archaeon]